MFQASKCIQIQLDGDKLGTNLFRTDFWLQPSLLGLQRPEPEAKLRKVSQRERRLSRRRSCYQNGAFHSHGGAQNGWLLYVFVGDNPFKMDDLGAPLFQETSKYGENMGNDGT